MRGRAGSSCMQRQSGADLDYNSAVTIQVGWCNGTLSHCVQVYISCSVMVCEAGNPSTRCSQGCINSTSPQSYRGKREAVFQTAKHFVSQGPLRLRSSESTGKADFVFFSQNIFHKLTLLEGLQTSESTGFKVSISFCFFQRPTWTWIWYSSLGVFSQRLPWSVQWSFTKAKRQRSNISLCHHLKIKTVVSAVHHMWWPQWKAVGANSSFGHLVFFTVYQNCGVEICKFSSIGNWWFIMKTFLFVLHKGCRWQRKFVCIFVCTYVCFCKLKEEIHRRLWLQ